MITVFEFKIVFPLNWLPTTAGETRLTCYLTHCWGKNRWIHTSFSHVNVKNATGFRSRLSEFTFIHCTTHTYIFRMIFIGKKSEVSNTSPPVTRKLASGPQLFRLHPKYKTVDYFEVLSSQCLISLIYLGFESVLILLLGKLPNNADRLSLPDSIIISLNVIMNISR